MIQLTPAQQRFVDEQIATGAFQDSEAVIRAAFALLESASDREAAETIRDIRQGHEDIEAGRGVTVDEAFARIRQNLGRSE